MRRLVGIFGYHMHNWGCTVMWWGDRLMYRSGPPMWVCKTCEGTGYDGGTACPDCEEGLRR